MLGVLYSGEALMRWDFSHSTCTHTPLLINPAAACVISDAGLVSCVAGRLWLLEAD